MKIIRNGKQISENSLQFNPTKSFYYFVAMVRKKDHPDKQIKDSQIVGTWCIKDLRDYTMFREKIADVLKQHGARLYMCTDRKSYVKTMVCMRDKLQKHLDATLCNPKFNFSTALFDNISHSSIMKDESSDKDARKWLFDIDTADKRVIFVIMKMCDEYFECVCATPNGYHIVAKRKFDAKNALRVLKTNDLNDKSWRPKFTDEDVQVIQENADKIEVKTNAMVLVNYINGEN